MRTDDGEHLEWFDVSQGLRQGCMLSPLIFNVFTTAIHAVLVRFGEDILSDLVHFEENLTEDGVRVNADPLTCVRREVWGMLYVDDAGIVSKSVEGLAKMMAVIVTVFEAAGLTVSEIRRRPCCCGRRTRYSGPPRSSSRQQAQGVHRQRSFCIWVVLSAQVPT